MQRETNTRQAQTTDFFSHYHVVAEVCANTAVLLGGPGTQHSLLASLVPKVTIDLAVFLPLHMLLVGFVHEELANHIPKDIVL